MKNSRVIYLVAGVILLAGVFYVLKPKEPPVANNQNSEPEASSDTTTPVVVESNVKTFGLVVKGKKITSGAETLTVTQGNEVIINITADEEEEFHIHGYDKFVNLEKDKPASLSFTADITGRFPFELEHSKTDIGVLEVLPK